MTDPRAGAPPPVLLITGGSRGIGAAIAELAATEGYAVCFTYATNHDDAVTTAQTLRSRGAQVEAVMADVADPQAAVKVFEQAERALGPVTAVVNNAGVTGRIGPFHEAPPAELRRVVDVNVLGTVAFAQEAVRRWLQRDAAGAMVNISSIAAVTGSPHEYVTYAASKAAVETLTVGLAKEVAASGIRVNAVAPGTISTQIHAAAGEPDRPKRVVGRIPMRRVGEAREIAPAVLWLLSDAASYVTGTVLRVAGGL